MQDVHGVSEAVKGNGQVFLLHRGGKTLEHGHLVPRVHKALAILVELADGVDRQIHALVLGEVQRIEGPGIKDLLGHSKIFKAHLWNTNGLFPRRGLRRSACLSSLALCDIGAVHHAENSQIFIAHVLGLIRHRACGLKICNDRQLLHHLLQEFHLIGTVNIRHLFIILFCRHLGTELEDRTGDLPHRAQHALQGTHRQVGHHAGQG
mmetsp:Transcript_23601/g.51321  ORF Transcript_23601/g.51321 Transcript_23601/m.51321 type:complete len:207 (+) Transcript_23601:921-1541(+)